MPDLRLRLNKDMLVVAPLLTWQLLDMDMDENECLEYLNILDEEVVRETHRRFRLAGAHCTCTNTLKANRINLQAFGLEEALVDVNRLGVQLAHEAGFEHVLATVCLAETEILLEQVAALLPEDPDAIWLVGKAEGDELNAAIDSIKNQTSLPLIAAAIDGSSKTQGADIIYTMGKTLEESLEELRSLTQHYTEPLMICPDVGRPEGATKKQRSMALNQLADNMTDFSLGARALGAQFVGTAPGSSPVLTGSASAVLSGLDTQKYTGPTYIADTL